MRYKNVRNLQLLLYFFLFFESRILNNIEKNLRFFIFILIWGNKFIQTSRNTMKEQINKKNGIFEIGEICSVVILVDTLRTYNFCCINVVKNYFFLIYLLRILVKNYYLLLNWPIQCLFLIKILLFLSCITCSTAWIIASIFIFTFFLLFSM